MCYRDRIILLSQNDYLCPKNALSEAPLKVINYRDFKKFGNERFMNLLLYTPNEERIDYSKNPDIFF